MGKDEKEDPGNSDPQHQELEVASPGRLQGSPEMPSTPERTRHITVSTQSPKKRDKVVNP